MNTNTKITNANGNDNPVLSFLHETLSKTWKIGKSSEKSGQVLQ